MNNQTPVSNGGRSPGRTLVVVAAMIVAGIYLANPTFGLLELIPDAVPLVGNLDEAGAVMLLLSGLRYFGMDLTMLFGRGDAEKRKR